MAEKDMATPSEHATASTTASATQAQQPTEAQLSALIPECLDFANYDIRFLPSDSISAFTKSGLPIPITVQRGWINRDRMAFRSSEDYIPRSDDATLPNRSFYKGRETRESDLLHLEDLPIAVVAMRRRANEDVNEMRERADAIMNFASWFGLIPDEMEALCVVCDPDPRYPIVDDLYGDDIVLFDDDPKIARTNISPYERFLSLQSSNVTLTVERSWSQRPYIDRDLRLVYTVPATGSSLAPQLPDDRRKDAEHLLFWLTVGMVRHGCGDPDGQAATGRTGLARRFGNAPGNTPVHLADKISALCDRISFQHIVTPTWVLELSLRAIVPRGFQRFSSYGYARLLPMLLDIVGDEWENDVIGRFVKAGQKWIDDVCDIRELYMSAMPDFPSAKPPIATYQSSRIFDRVNDAAGFLESFGTTDGERIRYVMGKAHDAYVDGYIDAHYERKLPIEDLFGAGSIQARSQMERV